MPHPKPADTRPFLAVVTETRPDCWLWRLTDPDGATMAESPATYATRADATASMTNTVAYIRSREVEMRYERAAAMGAK